MAYTVTQLITSAYYLSGVVARELETVTGAELSDGLRSLNALLSSRSNISRLIPYFTEYELDLVVGTEKYNIPNLVYPETVTFNLGDIRYSMSYRGRSDYFGRARIDNVTSLPFEWHFERVKGGADLYIYFKPSDTYTMKIWGKFSLSSVTLNQDLELTYDLFYIDYLRYKLAKRLCTEFGVNFPSQADEELQEIEKISVDISPSDLTVSKLTTLGSDSGLNWGDRNLGGGWRPKR